MFWGGELRVFGWNVGHLSGGAVVAKASLVGWIQILEKALNVESKEVGFCKGSEELFMILEHSVE